MQGEAQSVLQQKPSAQNPDAHWLALVHACPCGFFGWQAPPPQ
jgi:hypothetical protein